MSAAWTAFDFKRALRTAVAARDGITGLTPEVRVVTYFPSADEPLTDSIVVGFELRDDKEQAALGGHTHDETVEVVSQVRVVRPGAGQAVADQAEDRAKVILAEVDAEMRTGTITVAGAQIINPTLVGREMALYSQLVADGASVKVCVIEFTIRYKAKTAP